jgi:hypothetical protein
MSAGCGPGGCRRPLSTAASGNRGRCPDGRCPAGTLPQSAGALLPEPVAGPAAAGRVPPLPVGVGELAAEPVTELGAHVGHGGPLQGQGLLARQPAKPQAREVAAALGGDHRADGRLRVDPDLGPGVGGPGAQLHGEVGQKHQLAAFPVGVAGQQLV